jgi:Amt family ammonium transporter
VIAVHLVGGLFGSIALGFFADSAINELVPDGLLIGGGNAELLIDQMVASVAVFAFAWWSPTSSPRSIDLTIGLRVDEETEDIGLDQVLHAETAYNNLLRGRGGAGSSTEL